VSTLEVLAAALAATLAPGRLAEPLSAHRPGPGVDDDEDEEDDDEEEPLRVSD
jgi:hypothetical protein